MKAVLLGLLLAVSVSTILVSSFELASGNETTQTSCVDHGGVSQAMGVHPAQTNTTYIEKLGVECSDGSGYMYSPQ